MEIRSYRDLGVWQKAMDLAVACNRLAASFPIEERYGLAMQLRRASVSVPANIAEGRGRHGTKEFIRFLSIARGSLAELETHLELARRLRYVDDARTQDLFEQSAEITRMLNGLNRTLRKRLTPKSPSP